MFCVAHVARVRVGGLPQNQGSPHDLYPESLHIFQSFLVVAFIMSISVITFSAYVSKLRSKVCSGGVGTPATPALAGPLFRVS